MPVRKPHVIGRDYAVVTEAYTGFKLIVMRPYRRSGPARFVVYVERSPKHIHPVSFPMLGNVIAIQQSTQLEFILSCESCVQPGLIFLCVNYSKQDKGPGKTGNFDGSILQSRRNRDYRGVVDDMFFIIGSQVEFYFGSQVPDIFRISSDETE